MTSCKAFHEWARTLTQYRFSFDRSGIPPNGIYLLFEKGERGHGGERIVRVGTHTGEGQLLSRLKQHFITPNKDRSIFRKNVGRALLARDRDPFLADWELDLTPAATRARHAHRIDATKQESVEGRVSDYIRDNFSFAIIRINGKEERLRLESRIISTVSLCPLCKASAEWLGSFSPKEKIRESGLWIVNELYKKPLDDEDFTRLKETVL
ncbi:hypothetical protein A2118_00220 [Candidatus Kaiserbacteria bacterium GWA2_50_9]|uniref:GIY-YIG domain-containing protein n=1 Tax=Candidatus Kaiserbacteria bacterium GWA2_50_9 TaxID=1798474 RepID=A0A1F6BSM5_9BACT|nr:MAG: hypothetical protein A2118_00220 [Candidatus Kaiserbacteria bacterium GWA2_50_9]